MQSDRFYVVCRVIYAVAWALTTTLSLVYMVEDVGLDPLQMVLVGTVLEATVFLFEIPTGVMADRVSRRLSVIIGHLLMGAGFIVFALSTDFAVILLAQVIWGVGATFISGAWAAWLSSEVGVERANHAFLRGSQYGHGAAFVGIALAVWLGHYSTAASILAGGFGFVLLGLLMAALMRETQFEPAAPEARSTWLGLATTLVAGAGIVRHQPTLMAALGITALFGMFSEGWDRLFTPLLIESFEFPTLGALDGVTWWGILAAVSSLAGLVATSVARRRVKLEDQRRLTAVLALLLVAVAGAVTLAANASGFLMLVVLYWLVGALRSAYRPLMTAWLNTLLPERHKATLFSMYGQADALGQTGGGPLIGVIAKWFSISIALTVSAVVLLPGSLIYLRIRSRFVRAE